MKDFIKKYWTHILNLIFLIYSICIFMFINYMGESIEIITLLLSMLLLFVIGIWIEIIYFIIRVIKIKEIKNKVLVIFLIYILNVFYIPCFVLKNIYKDNKSKIKNIFYVIISIFLYILLAIIIFKVSFSEINYKQYISNDNVICITVPNNYNDINSGNYDMYFTKNKKLNIGIFLYDDTGETAGEILNFQKIQLQQTRNDFKLMKTDYKYKDGKTITTHFCEGKYNDIKNYYCLSTITFDNKNNYVVYLIGISAEENYQKEIENILDKLKLNQ